ncbi:bone morphogenetic protein 2-like [Cydia amplana]|uniref:bone morphogenetic protein 2-like n=1 Tax=Cydia amplana TaxID=1869771 RepID=UPI002FE5B836
MPAKPASINQPEDNSPPSYHTSMPEYVCQRRPLTVRFADLGWSDYILALYDYDAGYCSGECLPQNLPNTTGHAIIQTLKRKIQDAVPRPCCVPTEFEPIALLYISEERDVVIRNFSDMKVKSCGCR